MITHMDREQYLEVTRQACRWYVANQNTNEHPWGGVAHSADRGRFLYEWFPSENRGRGGVVWTQSLGIMALHALLLQTENYGPQQKLIETCKLAGLYLLNLQYRDRFDKKTFGALAEDVPNDAYSFPRDGASGGMGLCVLYRITKDQKYLDAALDFAEWYRNHGSDRNGWPYLNYSFAERKADNKGLIEGDWQAGGGLFYYYLGAITKDRRYIDDYLLPMIPRLVKIYKESEFDEKEIGRGFHGKVPISYGNDDFALITLLAAYLATGTEEYYEVAKDQIEGLLRLMDPETGRFPSFGGTFVSGLTIKVLSDVDRHLDRRTNPRLVEALERSAKNGVELQAWDYNDVRVHGGFWGQSNFGVSKHWICHRSTGYAAILYAMLGGRNAVPDYHCLHWKIPGQKAVKPVRRKRRK